MHAAGAHALLLFCATVLYRFFVVCLVFFLFFLIGRLFPDLPLVSFEFVSLCSLLAFSYLPFFFVILFYPFIFWFCIRRVPSSPCCSFLLLFSFTLCFLLFVVSSLLLLVFLICPSVFLIAPMFLDVYFFLALLSCLVCLCVSSRLKKDAGGPERSLGVEKRSTFCI